MPDVWLGSGAPWVLAGHAHGGWSAFEPSRALQGLPFPGLILAATPLAWYDSVTVVYGDGAAWNGFEAGLARAVGWPEHPHARRATAIVDLRSGDFGIDENSLSIERGDSLSWIRGEALGGNRGAFGPLGLMGRHLWGASMSIRRGAHRLMGTYAQRGEAGSLANGEEEAGRGESGSAGYQYHRESLDGQLTFERGHDNRESFGGVELDSQREAQAEAATAEVWHRVPARDLAARFQWRRERVTRTGDGAFDDLITSTWGALRYERPLGEGRARLELGGGWHGAIQRLEISPSLSYIMTGPVFNGRIGIERLLRPVWTDLVDQEPFLQRTWAGVVDMGVGAAVERHARAVFLAGRTTHRALVSRQPLEELWLRGGVKQETKPYNFGLLTLSGAWPLGHVMLGGEGYVLARNQSPDQPRVDPAYSLRPFTALRFTAFQGDLGIVIRVEAEAVGIRESEAQPTRSLPAYVTAGAAAVVTLADAIVTVRVRNLENQRREEVWIDPLTDAEARGPGRAWTFGLTLHLSD